MLLLLFLLFTLMPLLELWLLFQLSGVFGFWTTVAVVLLTGFVGAWLAKMQGWLTMFRIRSELASGKLPAEAMGDGVMLLVAGVLLITPGVITDVVGLSLLLPPVRIVVRKLLKHWFAKHVKIETNASFWQSGPGTNTPSRNPNVVEGRVVDAHVVEDNLPPSTP